MSPEFLVTAKIGNREVHLTGLGQRFRAEVWRGKVSREFHSVLTCLQFPSCRPAIIRAWKVRMPQRIEKVLKNTGADRKFLVFAPDRGAPIVLRFQTQIPAELKDAWNAALSGPIPRKETAMPKSITGPLGSVKPKAGAASKKMGNPVGPVKTTKVSAKGARGFAGMSGSKG